MAENGRDGSGAPPERPEFLQKIESAVATALHLVPQVIRTCAQYSFRPNRFLEQSLATEQNSYQPPPYTFLAVTSLVTIFAIGLTVAALVTITESFINAITWMAPAANEGPLLLARQIDAIQNRSFGGILLSAGVVVVAVAALARSFSEIAPHHAQARLERVLCYAAGGQQIQAVLLMPGLVLLIFVGLNYFDSPWISVLLFGALAYVLVWPVVVAGRAIKRVAVRYGWLRSMTWGLLFALVNPAIAGLTVYGATAAPRLLEDWRAELLPRGAPLEYRIAYARGAISEDGELLLTVAVEILAGRPLVIDTERLNVSSAGLTLFGGWLHSARLLDSSDGTGSAIVIRPGETKWIRIAVDMSYMEDFLLERLDLGRWSSQLNFGDDEVALDDVIVDDPYRLRRERGAETSSQP